MIQLVRPETSPLADEIETIFQSWVLAYRCRVVQGEENDPNVPSPVILDGDKRIQGEMEIRSWVRELERELTIQRSVSGDGCYIDPDSGEVC